MANRTWLQGGVEPDENGDPITSSTVSSDHVSDAGNVTVLKGWEAVRLRPGMYIGDVGVSGLHHLFREIINGSVDEVLAGHCNRIDVVLGENYTLSVSDNGRSIPVDIVGISGKTSVEWVFTTVSNHTERKERGYTGAFSSLGFINMAIVNALSEWLHCTVKRHGKVYRMRFERGAPVTALEIVGECSSDESGITVVWLADKTIFQPALTDSGDLAYNSDLLGKHCRELAYHLFSTRITFEDRRHKKPRETFYFPNGVADCVRDMKGERDMFPAEPIAIRGTVGKIQVEVALQYSETDGETILGFANTIPTPENGTHITGFLRALTSSINSLVVSRTKHDGKKIRRGIAGVVSVLLPHPQFNHSSKVRLDNPEIEGIVYSMVYAGLKGYFRDNPEVARAMAERFAGG